MRCVDNFKKIFISDVTLRRKQNSLTCLRKTINTTVSPKKTEGRSLTARPRQSCKNNTQAVQAMKACKWCGSMGPLILYFGTKWSIWLQVLADLFPGKNSGTHWIGEWESPQIRSGRFAKHKYFICMNKSCQLWTGCRWFREDSIDGPLPTEAGTFGSILGGRFMTS